MRRFTDLAELSREQVLELIELAQRLERAPEPQALRGRVLGLLFMNPSLRTLASFQSGMARLGGDSFVINPGHGTWRFETRSGVVMDGEAAEHIREGLPVLGSYCDVLGIRVFADGLDLAADLADVKFAAMAALIDKPLINLESAINHPCQALADWKTLEELDVPRTGKFVLSWAYHPRALPLAVPAAVVQMAAMRGMEVVILRPEGFGLPEPVLERARRAARQSGGSVRETTDRTEALSDAQVVYVKEWTSSAHYGNPPAEAQARRMLRDWMLSDSWLERARPECRLMHCLPVRRNVAVADSLLDGPHSAVLRQAYNRLPAQMAVLYRLLKNAE